MASRFPFIALLALAAVTSAVPAQAQSDDDRYTIMRPEPSEPWLPPNYKSPRGSRNHVVNPRPAPTPQTRVTVPPPLYVPQTGQLLPNLPTVSGSGPGGAETSQDRAVRCAHQAGVYGQAAGDRNAYVGGCINQ
jgi:hypothetical protein